MMVFFKDSGSRIVSISIKSEEEFNLKNAYFVGVDGGATKTIVRIEDKNGQLIGEHISGPANIRLSPTQAWQSIHAGLNAILSDTNLDEDQELHSVIGIAGCEIPSAVEEFSKLATAFTHMQVLSDAHTACLGAHGGENGAVIIIGTGTVGIQIENGQMTQVGGWGFPHDDEGGGAWLGLQAIRHYFQTQDGRDKPSALSEAIRQHFKFDDSYITFWSNQANSTVFASLAPIVIEQALGGEEVAISLLHASASAVNSIYHALCHRQKTAESLSYGLVGGLARYIEPYLEKSLRERIRPAQLSPVEGAALLARQKWG